MKRPLRTSIISSGMRHLLEEGEYANLARLLRFQRIDMQRIYHSIFDKHQNTHMICIYELFNSGFIAERDAKLLLPSALVSECTDMNEISPYEILKLPVNPLINGVSASADLKESALIAALHRGIRERDPEMIWTAWPLLTPKRYTEIWQHSEFWRILLVESFTDIQPQNQKKFLSILRERLEGVLKFPSAASYELIMINVTLVAFYLDHLFFKKAFLNTGRTNNFYSNLLKELDDNFISLFDMIKSSPIANTEILLKGLNLQSTTLIATSQESLCSNPFYYEDRIELFANIVEKLRRIPDVFADWFSNLFFAFADVVSKMSLNLLSSTWVLFLSFKPSIEGICHLLTWLKDKIDENYRFELAKMISYELLPNLFKECECIPDPLTLIPLGIRESRYLMKWRQGTQETYVYDFRNFWSPNQLPVVLLLKLFHEMDSTESTSLDFFESFDTFFILENPNKLIHLRKFLEMILNLFIKVTEWYIPLDDESKEIIPSPLFPSQFAPFLAQIIVRCRHVLCEYPFKIPEIYFKLSYNCVYEEFPHEHLEKFASSEVKYLLTSNSGRLPKLSASYTYYFQVITRIHDQEQDQHGNFFKNHLTLYKTIRYLWRCEGSEMNQREREEVELGVLRSVSKTLELFGIELHKFMGGNVFSDTELHHFLFK